MQGVCELYGGFIGTDPLQNNRGTCDRYNNMREGQINDIIEAVEKCVAAFTEEPHKLIDESQPVKFF